MQNKKSEYIQEEIIDQLEFFSDKITSGFTILEQTEVPYIMFSFSFIMYNYFNVILNYDRGRFGCSLPNEEVRSHWKIAKNGMIKQTCKSFVRN